MAPNFKYCIIRPNSQVVRPDSDLLSRLFFLIFPSEQQKQRYYIQAPGCDDLLPVCNEVEEMEKMEKIKAHQEQYGAKRGASSKRGRGPEKQTFKRQTVHIIPNDFLLFYRTYCQT